MGTCHWPQVGRDPTGCQNPRHDHRPPVPATATALARSAGYDVVLLAHVLSALVGLGAVVVAGGYALALSGRAPAPRPCAATTDPGSTGPAGSCSWCRCSGWSSSA